MYNDSLAAIHDHGFGFYARAAAKSVKSRLTPRPTTLLELGCGSGIFCDALGMDLTYTGIDISPQMLNIAKERLARISPILKTGSIYDTEFNKADFIVGVGEIFSYCTEDELHLDSEYFTNRLQKLFGKARAALPESGFFLFDVILKKEPASLAAKTYFDNDNWSVLVEAECNNNYLRRQIIIFSGEQPGIFRKDVEIHTLYLYEKDQIAELLTNAGFSFEIMSRYNDFELAPNRAGFFCRPV